MKMNREQLTDTIKAKIKQKGISILSIAEGCGITKQAIRNSISLSESVSNKTLIKIAGQIGYYLEIVENPNGKYYKITPIKK